MVTHFFDGDGPSSHDQFQDWRTNHQDGIFLTLGSRASANLHGARCTHLGSGPPYFSLEDGLGSLTARRKVCGTEDELSAWATENGVSVKPCQHCLRDNLITVKAQLISSEGQIRMPEEVPGESFFIEGSVQRIVVNRYERDVDAREQCVLHHGTTCVLCAFDFASVYGKVMEGFIHVHHLRPLSSVGPDYKIDPARDLRPVCPNCHAVLHRRESPYSLEEVRQFLENQGGTRATQS